jgi:hypothetical protein
VMSQRLGIGLAGNNGLWERGTGMCFMFLAGPVQVIAGQNT